MQTATDRVDLSGAWNSLYAALTAFPGAEPLFLLLTLAGGALAAFAILRGLHWKFVRAGAQQGSNWMGPQLLVACMLTAPMILFPIILTVFDLVVNAVVSVFQGTV